jgi:hypothetical protein
MSQFQVLTHIIHTFSVYPTAQVSPDSTGQGQAIPNLAKSSVSTLCNAKLLFRIAKLKKKLSNLQVQMHGGSPNSQLM